MVFVALVMFVHPLVPVALDCHWIVHVPVPPPGVAVNVTLPPTHTEAEEGAILIEGSEITVKIAGSLVTGGHPD